MTLSPWLIYLWGLADDLRFAFGGAAAIGLLVVIVGAVFSPFLFEEITELQLPKVLKVVKRLLIGWVVVAALSVFTPSSKTIALMVVVPAVLNSEPIQKDLPEIYEMAKEALKQTLKTK